MRNPSLYRIGGSALALGAVLFGVGVMLHAPQPMDLTSYLATSHGQWMVSHWMLAASQLFLVGGSLALARHLFGTNGDGWATLGLAGSLVTGALFVGVIAPEIVAFQILADQGTDAGVQHAYAAVSATLISQVHVGIVLFWFGMGSFGMAMLRDTAFPRWLGQAGIALAMIEIVANFTPLGTTGSHLVILVGAIWLAYAGYTLSKVKAA